MTVHKLTKLICVFIIISVGISFIDNDRNDIKVKSYISDTCNHSTLSLALTESLPEATIITNEDNSVIVTWNDDTYTGKLNGKPYIKDTVIRQEGNHLFIIRNAEGHTRPYRFSIGHYYVVSENMPTCEEEGYILHKCVNCGDSYKTDITMPLGHKFLTERISATCTESGYVSQRCEICNFEYRSDVVYPSGHSYNAEILKQATCITMGERRLCCEYCGDVVFATIPPIGHEYIITDAKIEKGLIHRTYTCKNCNDTYSQNLGDQYEKVTSYVEFLFNKYSPYMWWVLIAVSGVWSIVIGVAIIIAHRNDDKEKAKKMLINYTVGLIVIFAIIVACPYLIKGIAALVGK